MTIDLALGRRRIPGNAVAQTSAGSVLICWCTCENGVYRLHGRLLVTGQMLLPRTVTRVPAVDVPDFHPIRTTCTIAKTALVAGVLFAFVLSLHARPASQQVIPFKVVAKVGQAMALLVAPSPTDEQLTALLNAFRAARMKGTLAQLIPATTPNAKVGGPYNVVTAIVISDPAAGNNPMLNMFVNPKTSGISDNEKEWGKRILAYYWYSSIAPKGGQEEGALGYKLKATCTRVVTGKCSDHDLDDYVRNHSNPQISL